MSSIFSKCIVVVVIVGCLPLPTFVGVRFSANAQTSSASRERFIREVVPAKYPMLLSCLKSGAEEVVWVAQSGEKQSQTVKLVEGSGVVIDTTVFVGSSPSSATVSTETAKVTMMDLDRDGVMDRIQYVMPDGSKQGYNRDFDEGSQFLWDSALAITFQYSNCFRN